MNRTKKKLSYDELLNLSENLEKRIKVLEEKVLKLKDVEEVLRDSEQRFQQLADSTFEGIIIHENATILDINQQMAFMLGYDETELIGKSLLEFILIEYRKDAIQSIRSDYQMAYNTVMRKRNGELLEVEVLSRPFLFKSKRTPAA